MLHYHNKPVILKYIDRLPGIMYIVVRNCISQVAEAGFYEKDSFLFTVDGLFLFIPVIYNSLLESQSSTIGDYLILEDT